MSSPSILLPTPIAQPDDKFLRQEQDAPIAPCLPSSLSSTPPPHSPISAPSPFPSSPAAAAAASASATPSKPNELCYQAAYHRELRISAPLKVHFPPMHSQPSSASPALFLSVRCPPDLRSFTTSIYAIALLTIDGRRYRLQGWLSRTSTCQVLPSDPSHSSSLDQLICVSTSQPVWLISRIQNRAERDLDWLVGEWNVGKEGLLSSGSYRFVAVVRDQESGNVYMSEPTHHAVDVRVDDDWEFVNGQPTSLQDMIDHYQNKPLQGMDMKTPLRHQQYTARWESPVDVVHGFREEW